jgi:hypothetical protein
MSFLDNPTKAVGEYVCLKTLDLGDSGKFKGFLIDNKSRNNDRLGLYEVISVGDVAYQEYGIEPGMKVYADRLACIGWRKQYPIIKYNSIIYIDAPDEELAIKPVKGTLIVVDEKTDKYVDYNGFKILETNSLKCGLVLAINKEDSEYKVGDKTLLTTGADVINTSKYTIRIYKEDMLIAKVVNEE